MAYPRRTPGYWIAGFHSDTLEWAIFANYDGRLIARVGEDISSLEECAADANLMAASPRLLNAIDALLCAFADKPSRGELNYLQREAVKYAREAIEAAQPAAL